MAAVAEALRCPECGRGLIFADSVLRCERGHSFDIARQGYVSLLTGAAGKLTGDSAAMLDARAAFQSAGYFTPVAEAIADAAVSSSPERDGERVLDIGAGTGYYTARVLDALPAARGIALDIAKAAGRRCARAHPRAAAVVADAWRGLPVGDHTITLAMSVFAPRNPGEIVRALAPAGRYIVVTPTAAHLAELIDPLGMVTVDPDKDRRLTEALAGRFERRAGATVEYPMSLPHEAIAALVGMGPSAHHAATPADRIAALPDPCTVTASVSVAVYTPTAGWSPADPHLTADPRSL